MIEVTLKTIRRDGTIVLTYPNRTSYYPETIEIYKHFPVVSRYFIYRLALVLWILRVQLGYRNIPSPYIWYVHPSTVITPGFLMPYPYATYSKKKYIAEAKRLCKWKPSNIPYPISKKDFLNQSLEIINHSEYKIKSTKNIYKGYTFDKNTGRHINRPESPPIVIHLFILLTKDVTETSLHFSYVTTLIKTINTWFATHPNTFYDKYAFYVKIRLLYDVNARFLHRNNKSFIMNKQNPSFMDNIKTFQMEFESFYIRANRLGLKSGKVDCWDDEDDSIPLDTIKDKIDYLHGYFTHMIEPFLEQPSALISLVPSLKDFNNLPFYEELFKQSLKEVTCRVRKPSLVSVNSVIYTCAIGDDYRDPISIPFFAPAGSYSAQYNINAFIYTTADYLTPKKHDKK